MAEPRRVKCLDCGTIWESEAETPRCSDPNDVCGRSRNTMPVDELDYAGPVWLLACPDCGNFFDGTSTHDECPQCGDHVSPASIVRLVDDGPEPLIGLGVGDKIAISLEDQVQVLTGEITEVGSGGWDVPEEGAHVSIYVRGVDDIDDVLVLESTIEHAGGEWSPVTALDLDVAGGDDRENRVDLGRVKSIAVDQSADPRPKRVETLEDAGLSGQEARVVALKERGYTHAVIADLIDLPKSTVDEYSRRARKKVKQARSLVDAAGGVYE